MAVQDFTEPNVCIDENLTTDSASLLMMQPWAVPRLVVDVKASSGGDGNMLPELALPGKLLIDQQVGWRNDTPIEQTVLLRVTRNYKSWIVSNPNAIQFRDRWTYAVDATPSVPVTTGIFNSQVGSAIDAGSNTVAEPNPGVQWVWWPTNSTDDWLSDVNPIPSGAQINLWYRCYVWTPPPWSDNANKNSPKHEAFARWTRLELRAFPTQGTVISG